MLLFIHARRRRYVQYRKFKYISCYCLSEKQLILAKDTLKFKYISCYCLSDIIMLVDEDGLNSNTSHVIVYRATPWTDQQILVFKYISCYCLSNSSARTSCSFLHSNTSHVIVYRDRHQTSKRIQQFKYISCYCLSAGGTDPSGKRFIQIHLMLLFIRYTPAHSSGGANSNTSHVIVYLFDDIGRVSVTTFKYISCYCLSS